MNIKEIILFLSVLNFSLNILHRCGADTITKKPTKVKDSEDNKNKRKLANEYTPLKIYVDYTYIERQKYLTSSQMNYLKNMLEEVTYYLSELLSTVHFKVQLEDGLIESSCEIPLYESRFRTAINDYDLLIFPFINDTLRETEVIAQAWACLTLVSNNRPVAGVVEINPDFSMDKSDTSYYMKYILLHEISHILGFSYYFFEELNLMKTERKNGITRDYINSTKVKEKAREHFNCKNIEGVQLENQGGLGSAMSHWDSRYMLGDYMISTDYPEYAISDITLAFFEDTGFYKVNYYTGGLFRYGKNQGCSFLKDDCIHNNGTDFPNEFCTEPGAYFCSSSLTNRGDCYIVEYNDILPSQFRNYENVLLGGFFAADYCPVSFNYYVEDLEERLYYPFNCNFGESLYSSMGETIGEKSICFESSLMSERYSNNLKEKISICHEVECDRQKKTFNIVIGGNTLTCPKKSTILKDPEGFTGEIKCPDYNRVCTSEIWCNELFDCTDKKSLADRGTYDYNGAKYLVFNKIIGLFILFIINDL